MLLIPLVFKHTTIILSLSLPVRLRLVLVVVLPLYWPTGNGPPPLHQRRRRRPRLRPSRWRGHWQCAASSMRAAESPVRGGAGGPSCSGRSVALMLMFDCKQLESKLTRIPLAVETAGRP